MSFIARSMRTLPFRFFLIIGIICNLCCTIKIFCVTKNAKFEIETIKQRIDSNRILYPISIVTVTKMNKKSGCFCSNKTVINHLYLLCICCVK